MDSKVLDYEGLKKLVTCILAEIPQADGSTIIKNEDGTFTARTNFVPAIDGESGTLVFSSTPSHVDEETETFVFTSSL